MDWWQGRDSNSRTGASIRSKVLSVCGGCIQSGRDSLAIEASFVVALSALIALLVVGVFRRWRWTFWLVLIAFFFGVLRLPASALQLAEIIPASGPTWYEVLQGVIGAVQFLIAIAMFAGYRKAGVWGEF